MAEPTDRRRPRPMATTVRRTEWISSSMVRVVVGGGDLSRFQTPTWSDSYVKVLFLSNGVEYPRPMDLDAVRADLPAEHWPRLRTYTVREWDPAAVELTLDVVVHGDEGLAGPWARDARPGDEVLLLGPGGGYSPDPQADWHLLVGDESALPAIAVAAQRLGPDAVARIFVEVHSPDDEIRFPLPAAATVTWVHRGSAPVGELLMDAVRAAPWPEGSVHAFVHGEAGFVKELRRFLRIDRGLSLDQLSISGYWRHGKDDEGWRAAKRDWNREVEELEAAAGVA